MLNIIIHRHPDDPAEAVDILRDMVSRNLPEGFRGNFVIDGEHRPPADAEFHLSTECLIVGPLDDIATEAPESTFWRPDMDVIPSGAKIIEFAGKTKPWDVKTGWVPRVWKIGGGTPAEFVHATNVSHETIVENIRAAMWRDVAWLDMGPVHSGVALICAGGPSLADELLSIRANKSNGAVIYAANNTLRFLAGHGIEADAHVVCDARLGNLAFLPDPESPVERVYASQCDPAVLDAAGSNLTLWHPFWDGVLEVTGDPDNVCHVGGGTTAGLKAVAIAYARGYRKIHLYGFDSSYRGDENHAYPQPMNDGERIVDVTLEDDRAFKAAPWMVVQVEDFKLLAQELGGAGCELFVHGDGLLPAVADLLSRPDRTLTAVYDLAVSPPTFEFMSFLAEAEKARLAGGYKRLDVVFQPGPDRGFRDDQLPPSIPMRRSMLWRVCVAAARLLPAIGNVTVNKQRKPIHGDRFPAAWTLDGPVPHYGPKYCRDMVPILAASDVASQYVADRFPPGFVCITLRGAKHWANRNSDMKAWREVAAWLERNGFAVVWVPDEDGEAPSNSTIAAEAFFDVDIRAAIYEQAALCLGVSGGPTALMCLLNCRFLIFDKPDSQFPCGKDWLQRTQGFGPDPQFCAHGRVVWGSGDGADVVIPELERELLPARKIGYAA